ncbi:MAG: protein kinase, partial [Elusimicrobiota bacterium]
LRGGEADHREVLLVIGAGASSAGDQVVQGSAAERSALFTKEAANALRVRDYAAAYTQSSRAIGLNAQNAQALNYRAMALTQMNRHQEAVRDAGAALALAPGNATILQTRSRAFSHEGKYQEGLKDADETLLRDAANAFAYESKAFALAGLHDNAGAIEALRAAARIDPRFAPRRERALRLPREGDLILLFDDHASAASAAAPVPSPGSRLRRFLRLAALSAVGGLIIALAVLHVVSASWREKASMTLRRVLGSSASGGPEAGAPASAMGAFWTQYELVKEIGLGGMGVVYEALDRSLDRRVAVKKMRDEIRLDPQDRRRFVREAKMVAQLHHPNIVDIYGIVEDGPEIYLVFEFVEGRTLQDALKSSGPMDLGQAKRVLKEMAPPSSTPTRRASSTETSSLRT